MKILMLSTDQKIFDSSATAHQRMIGYSGLFDELHIVVYTKQGVISEKKISLTKNTFIYPTSSIVRPFYFFNVFVIVRKIFNKDAGESKWVITAQDPFETGLIGYLLKCFFHVPLQAQIHTDFLSPYFRAESPKNKYRVLIGKWIVRRADGIRVVSERIKKSIVEIYPSLVSRIVVLPVFVEIEKIRATTIRTDLHKKYPQFDFIILMASRLTREKNIPMAIDAMQQIVEKYPKTGLVIVGSGPEQNAIQNMIIEHNLLKNIILEPWTDDIPSYYKTADCYVLTSNYEGYGRTVVEAMASGCPAIMTDVGIAGELLKRGVSGEVIPVKNAVALSIVLERLISDSLYRVVLREGAFQAIEEKIESKDRYFALHKTSLQNL